MLDNAEETAWRQRLRTSPNRDQQQQHGAQPHVHAGLNVTGGIISRSEGAW